MPDAIKFEAEHVSHPLAGWPVEKQAGSEDGLTQLNGLAVWRSGMLYGEVGVGYNVDGRNGGGFYGPSLTGTVRGGIEIPLRRE